MKSLRLKPFRAPEACLPGKNLSGLPMGLREGTMKQGMRFHFVN